MAAFCGLDDSTKELTDQDLQICRGGTSAPNWTRHGLDEFRRHSQTLTAVLLDLTMPQMSGEEVLRHLRQLRPDVRVIVMSGYSEYEMHQRFAGQGVGHE
jgi:CheY-like chemotaxis protein